jgi:hypothetical protein
MAKAKSIFAIAYDFDGTLAPGSMQEHSFIPKLGMQAGNFWNRSNAFAKEQEGEPVLLNMYLMLEASVASVARVKPGSKQT